MKYFTYIFIFFIQSIFSQNTYQSISYDFCSTSFQEKYHLGDDNVCDLNIISKIFVNFGERYNIRSAINTTDIIIIGIINNKEILLRTIKPNKSTFYGESDSIFNINQGFVESNGTDYGKNSNNQFVCPMADVDTVEFEICPKLDYPTFLTTNVKTSTQKCHNTVESQKICGNTNSTSCDPQYLRVSNMLNKIINPSVLDENLFYTYSSFIKTDNGKIFFNQYASIFFELEKSGTGKILTDFIDHVPYFRSNTVIVDDINNIKINNKDVFCFDNNVCTSCPGKNFIYVAILDSYFNFVNKKGSFYRNGKLVEGLQASGFTGEVTPLIKLFSNDNLSLKDINPSLYTGCMLKSLLPSINYENDTIDIGGIFCGEGYVCNGYVMSNIICKKATGFISPNNNTGCTNLKSFITGYSTEVTLKTNNYLSNSSIIKNQSSSNNPYLKQFSEVSIKQNLTSAPKICGILTPYCYSINGDSCNSEKFNGKCNDINNYGLFDCTGCSDTNSNNQAPAYICSTTRPYCTGSEQIINLKIVCVLPTSSPRIDGCLSSSLISRSDPSTLKNLYDDGMIYPSVKIDVNKDLYSVCPDICVGNAIYQGKVITSCNNLNSNLTYTVEKNILTDGCEKQDNNSIIKGVFARHICGQNLVCNGNLADIKGKLVQNIILAVQCIAKSKENISGCRGESLHNGCILSKVCQKEYGNNSPYCCGPSNDNGKSDSYCHNPCSNNTYSSSIGAICTGCNSPIKDTSYTNEEIIASQGNFFNYICGPTLQCYGKLVDLKDNYVNDIQKSVGCNKPFCQKDNSCEPSCISILDAIQKKENLTKSNTVICPQNKPICSGYPNDKTCLTKTCTKCTGCVTDTFNGEFKNISSSFMCGNQEQCQGKIVGEDCLSFFDNSKLYNISNIEEKYLGCTLKNFDSNFEDGTVFWNNNRGPGVTVNQVCNTNTTGGDCLGLLQDQYGNVTTIPGKGYYCVPLCTSFFNVDNSLCREKNSVIGDDRCKFIPRFCGNDRKYCGYISNDFASNDYTNINYYNSLKDLMNKNINGLENICTYNIKNTESCSWESCSGCPKTVSCFNSYCKGASSDVINFKMGDSVGSCTNTGNNQKNVVFPIGINIAVLCSMTVVYSCLIKGQKKNKASISKTFLALRVLTFFSLLLSLSSVIIANIAP
jgi:hypothetical protein